MAAVRTECRCCAASAPRAETEPGRRVPSASGARTAAREAQDSGARSPNGEAPRGPCPVCGVHGAPRRATERRAPVVCQLRQLGDLLPRVTAIEIKSSFCWLSPSGSPPTQSNASQPESFTRSDVKTAGELQADQHCKKRFPAAPALLEAGTQPTVPSFALTF